MNYGGDRRSGLGWAFDPRPRRERWQRERANKQQHDERRRQRRRRYRGKRSQACRGIRTLVVSLVRWGMVAAQMRHADGSVRPLSVRADDEHDPAVLKAGHIACSSEQAQTKKQRKQRRTGQAL